MADGACVAIVLKDDPGLMERLVAEYPVWAARTAGSEALADRLLVDESVDASRFTIFNLGDGADIEGQLLYLIHEVELHHGASGGRPPLGRLDVYGTGPTERTTKNLGQFGLTLVRETSRGFSAAVPIA